MRLLAHELRNLIGTTRNAAYLIRLRKPSDTAILGAAQSIERQMDAMQVLLERAVDAEQIEHGEATPGFEPVDVHAAASQDSVEANRGFLEDRTAERQQKRILLVDDSAAVRDSFSDVLRDLGYEVRSTGDGEEALRSAIAWRPDYVFLDINIPLLDGFEVARRLRAQFTASELKLVMISGITLDAVATRDAKRAGFDFCFDKAGSFSVLDEWLRLQERA